MAIPTEQLRFLSKPEVFDLAKQFGTPLYVYDQASFTQQAKAALAMPRPFGLSVRLAMKAIGPNPDILHIFRALGVGIDASSEYEALEAIAAGFKPSDISITSQQFPLQIVELVKAGVTFNACSLHQLDEYGKLLPGSSVGIRLNPGLGSGHSAKTNVGGPSSSFGIWHEYTPEIHRLARKHRLTIERIHTHIGSGSDPNVWTKVAEMTLKHIEDFPTVTTVR